MSTALLADRLTAPTELGPNVVAARWAEDKRTLADGIGAIVGDVERLVGAPDEIARQAAGEA